LSRTAVVLGHRSLHRSGHGLELSIMAYRPLDVGARFPQAQKYGSNSVEIMDLMTQLAQLLVAGLSLGRAAIEVVRWRGKRREDSPGSANSG
jgi:hypothetical protein